VIKNFLIFFLFTWASISTVLHLNETAKDKASALYRFFQKTESADLSDETVEFSKSFIENYYNLSNETNAENKLILLSKSLYDRSIDADDYQFNLEKLIDQNETRSFGIESINFLAEEKVFEFTGSILTKSSRVFAKVSFQVLRKDDAFLVSNFKEDFIEKIKKKKSKNILLAENVKTILEVPCNGKASITPKASKAFIEMVNLPYKNRIELNSLKPFKAKLQYSCGRTLYQFNLASSQDVKSYSLYKITDKRNGVVTSTPEESFFQSIVDKANK